MVGRRLIYVGKKIFCAFLDFCGIDLAFVFWALTLYDNAIMWYETQNTYLEMMDPPPCVLFFLSNVLSSIGTRNWSLPANFQVLQWNPYAL